MAMKVCSISTDNLKTAYLEVERHVLFIGKICKTIMT